MTFAIFGPMTDGNRGTGRSTLMLEAVKRAAAADEKPVMVVAKHMNHMQYLKRAYQEMGGNAQEVYWTTIDQWPAKGFNCIVFRDHYEIESTLAEVEHEADRLQRRVRELEAAMEQLLFATENATFKARQALGDRRT